MLCCIPLRRVELNVQHFLFGSHERVLFLSSREAARALLLGAPVGHFCIFQGRVRRGAAARGLVCVHALRHFELDRQSL